MCEGRGNSEHFLNVDTKEGLAPRVLVTERPDPDCLSVWFLFQTTKLSILSLSGLKYCTKNARMRISKIKLPYDSSPT